MDTTLKNVKLNGKSYSYNTGTGQQKRTLIKYIKITIRLLINSQKPQPFYKINIFKLFLEQRFCLDLNLTVVFCFQYNK